MAAPAGAKEGSPAGLDSKTVINGQRLDGPVNGRSLNGKSVNGRGGPDGPFAGLRKSLTEADRTMGARAIAGMPVGEMKRLGEINDGLPPIAVGIDTLLAHGSASSVLRLFGDPQPVGESGQVNEVKFEDGSTITAYDGFNNLVLTRATGKETFHRHMLNGAVLADVANEEITDGAPRSRVIFFPPEHTTTIRADGSRDVNRSITTMIIGNGQVDTMKYDASKTPERYRDLLQLTEPDKARAFTLVEGVETELRGAEVRNATDGADDFAGVDKATLERDVDKLLKTADKETTRKIEKLTRPIMDGIRRGWSDSEKKQDIGAEGIRVGESVAVKDMLHEPDRYIGLFELMAGEDGVLEGKKGSEFFRFPSGTLTTNTNEDVDDIPYMTPDSRLVGSGRVGFLLREDPDTGERSASLYIKGRPDRRNADKYGVEEVKLDHAHMEVLEEPRSSLGFGIRFTIPQEEGGSRDIDIRSGVEKWSAAEKTDVPAFMSHITDIFVASSKQKAA